MPALPQHLSPSNWPASPLTFPYWLDGCPDCSAENLHAQTHGQMVRMETASQTVENVYCMTCLRVKECVPSLAYIHSWVPEWLPKDSSRETKPRSSVAPILKMIPHTAADRRMVSILSPTWWTTYYWVLSALHVNMFLLEVTKWPL